MRFFNKDPIIKFACEKRLEGALPSPIPASKATPKWYRKMALDTDSTGLLGTAKRCVPFKDAMDMGYIIPLWADLRVSYPNGVLDFSFQFDIINPTLGLHLPEQLTGSPLADLYKGTTPMKLYNPWVITTPPGWSCLFIQPMNHFDNKFNIVAGVVDTDKYASQVNLPFVWGSPDFEGIVPVGTPIVQVIPFKRTSWRSSVSALTREEWDFADAIKNKLRLMIHNGYRFNFWEPKKYK